MKHLSDEEKWNWVSSQDHRHHAGPEHRSLWTFLIYAVSIILAVLALYFTNGPTNEDLVHGGQFTLAFVVLVTIYVLATRRSSGR